MAIITATRISPRGRAALPWAACPKVSLPARLDQTRGLHFGPWCSYFRTEQRHDRRRHRFSRYHYIDILSRKLSWDNGSRSSDARLAMKRAMAHLMSGKRRAEADYVNADKVQSWSDDISGLRPGRNIEDAERDAIDHLFRSRGKEPYEHDLWMSPLRNIRNYLASQHAPRDVSPEDVITATTDHSHDPISPCHSKSRRLARHSSTRRKYLRELTASAHVNNFESEQPSATSSTRKGDSPSNDGSASDSAPQAESYGPVLWNEPDGLPEKSPEEMSKTYPDLEKYKPVSWNEPDGLQPKTTEEVSKNYDDLSHYTPVEWNEPDGLPGKTPEELSKSYDDLDKYTAVRWNEPDGLPKPTPEELSKSYDGLDKYKPMEWNEPDGLPELTPEEQSKKYNDLDEYSNPFTATEEAINAHASSQLDATVKAEPLEKKVEVPSAPADYEDLHKYGPVHWNEPDGLQKPTPEEESKDYKDLHLYGAVQWNEPDGLRKPTPEEQSKKYEDLQAYEAQSLMEDENVHNRVHPEEASKAYQDLHLYESRNLDSIDTPYPLHPEEASKAYHDLQSYKPVYHNEHLGAVSSQTEPEKNGLDVFDRRHDAPQYASHLSSRSRHYLGQEQETVDALTADKIRARMHPDGIDQDRLHKLDEDKAQHDTEWDVASGEAQQNVRHFMRRAPATLTGNYTRDFPEDFAGSWSAQSDSASLLPQHVHKQRQQEAAIAEHSTRDGSELSSMDESFPLPEPRMEPALDRVKSAEQRSSQHEGPYIADPHSNTSQGLETSYEAECAGVSTWPATFSHYHADTASRQASSASCDPPDKSVASDGAYKVLAYDKTTKSVSVADMTSGVLDQQPPLSPAEVMLKLSNPARFLPHFGSLHSQGYEVVSGSGDVLIFRKVRAGSPDAALERPGQSPVNPIDLMGKPVMGNFASPTGFVNYDSIADIESLKPEPPFRSDARKAEAFSSASTGEQAQSRPKKKGVTRKIVVGGALAASIAYAVGVMAEFFSTGGLDGIGSRGL